jgi:pimeloyl-ACP methyl ester carboxylesterase
MPTAGDIYYLESNGGTKTNPPIVLIHGAGGTHLHWPHNIRRLPGYRIISIDLPGHGKSKGLGQQNIHGYVKDLFNLYHALDIYRALLIGHSMGGAIALSMAINHPENVIGLGLIGTGARLAVNPNLLEKLSMPATFEPALKLIARWSFSKGTDVQIMESLANQLAENRPAVLHGDFVACNNFDVMNRLVEIKVPTCIICGDEDRMTPPRYSEYLSQKIYDALLQIIPNTGHMVMIEQPEEVANVLLEFISSRQLLIF